MPRLGFFAQARRANRESNDLGSYCAQMAPITVKVGLQLFVLALVAVMVLIGIIKVHDCTISEYIPFYLIASGGLYVLWVVAEIICDCFDLLAVKAWARLILGFLSFGVFVAGCYWIYGSWEDVQTRADYKEDDDYCDPYVYWIAFCDITVFSAFLLIVLFATLVSLVLTCCIRCFCKAEPDENQPLNPGASKNARV